MAKRGKTSRVRGPKKSGRRKGPAGRGRARAPKRDYAKENARRNAAAQEHGWKNRHELERAIRSKPDVVEAAHLRGSDRARVAALADGRSRFAGRKGSRARAADIAQLAAKIRKAGGNVSGFFEAIGSPKRRKK